MYTNTYSDEAHCQPTSQSVRQADSLLQLLCSCYIRWHYHLPFPHDWVWVWDWVGRAFDDSSSSRERETLDIKR